MQALVTAPGDIAVISSIPIPEPNLNEIRVKVHSVSLNPVDALYVAHHPSFEYGRVIGSDIAGTVDKTGSNASPKWTMGDRAAGLLQGATSGNKVARPGGFAEYAILEADLAFRIPEGVSFDEAATFPLCSLTAAQALFIRLRLPSPFPNPFKHAVVSSVSSKVPTLLVYSASTSLGLFTVQLAKLIDPPIRVIATASTANHSLLRDLGADSVFDYRSPNWIEDVKEASGGGIDFAVDCISEDKSTGMISQCFMKEECGGAGGEKRIAVIRAAAWDKNLVRSDVQPLYGAAWVGLGHEIIYNGNIIPADPTHRTFAVAFYEYLSSSSPVFPIKANPVRLMPGGLANIVDDGFTLIGSGKVADREKAETRQEKWMAKISAEKLVYRVIS